MADQAAPHKRRVRYTGTHPRRFEEKYKELDPARHAEELRKDFHDGVDDYLATCKEKNITPEQPFKGSFNVRVGRDLHRQVALEAARRGVSLNSLIIAALEKETHHAA